MPLINECTVPAVLTVDNSVVDLETIEALYENRATSDELEKIKKHYETSKEDEVKLLDKPEQYEYFSSTQGFREMGSRTLDPDFYCSQRTTTLYTQKTIPSLCVCDLLDCSSVKDVIGLVLAFGNYMNGGNRTRGQADGFGLEILPKLKDVKSRDNRISLVDYVVAYYLRNFDEHAGTDKSAFPLPEPQDFFLAAQVKFEDLTKDMRKLKRDLTACEKDVQKVCANSSEENLQPFKEKMEAFVSTGDEMFSHCRLSLRSLLFPLFLPHSFLDMVSYFGLKPKSGEKEVAPGYVFMLWYEFCSDFKNTWKRESKNISKERLKEAQENIKKITAEKRVETKKINANSLKERLRQKEASPIAVSVQNSVKTLCEKVLQSYLRLEKPCACLQVNQQIVVLIPCHYTMQRCLPQAAIAIRLIGNYAQKMTWYSSPCLQKNMPKYIYRSL
ncbi:unnamed protein product [Oncorhynchus mykiss]|uniref:FH2 domain-containing protein n=1 Tax=Oncorhynchus mykiss TaxID=8022 RepID=A0A060WVW5_ONCMY|nr:unnamed protein product [Oncorhynchus mykiss]